MKSEKVNRLPLIALSKRYESLIDIAYNMKKGETVKLLLSKGDPSFNQCRRWIKKNMDGYQVFERQGKLYMIYNQDDNDGSIS